MNVILYFVAIICILIFAYMLYEVRTVELVKLDMCNGQEGLKIIHISDVHINKLRVSYHKIKEIIDNENPDIILMSGDYIENRLDIIRFLDFIDFLSPKVEILLTFGNHDHKVFRREKGSKSFFTKKLMDLGVEIITNDSYYLEKNDIRYNIIGIDDIKYGKDNVKRALETVKGSSGINISFGHNPDIVFKFPFGGVDLLLCGHFHGGQIRAPFRIEFGLLREEKICKMGIIKGLNEVNGIKIYINRGLGNVCFPLRFLSKPEITVIKI